jgi:hypothetical protein
MDSLVQITAGDSRPPSYYWKEDSDSMRIVSMTPPNFLKKYGKNFTDISWTHFSHNFWKGCSRIGTVPRSKLIVADGGAE